MKEMMITMAIVQTVFVLIYIFFYDSPSQSHQLDTSALDKMHLRPLQDVMSEKEPSMTEQMKQAMKNKNFMLAMISSSLIVSITFSFPTIMEQILLPFDYTSNDVSIFGSCYNGFGIIGGILISIVLSK